MGVMKKMLRYSVGMAVAGIAGYELGRMAKKSSREGRMETREYAPSREERMQTREYVPSREERMEAAETPEYQREEPRDPRDYRSIYNL
ncbi:hypothetical protein [Methanocella arvoryzae]|nr:hypothetical protein [Methanocella arvoryzae]